MRTFVASLLTIAAAAGCAAEPAPTATALPTLAPSAVSTSPGDEVFRITSPAFAAGDAIPVDYTCDGANAQVPVEWSGAPEGTVEFALVMDDPDAGGFVHWVVVDIPASVTGIDAIPQPPGGRLGRNDRGREAYDGPCPPSGEHAYIITLYALSEPMALSSIPSGGAVRAAVEDKTLATTTLTGTYARP